jgi:creatinine amidohydrolase
MREIRYELLRPSQLVEQRERCPLIFVPIGPLEYHGPHLPVGVDPINAAQCAAEACRLLKKGVVMPPLYIGTERELPASTLESLGFGADDWIQGMDFPTAICRSLYQQEHVFGMIVADTLGMLIQQQYRVIIIVNGHGAHNQVETIDRLAKYFSHTSDALVAWGVALPPELRETRSTGHADVCETSLMLYYQQQYYRGAQLVDLSRLPPRHTPIRYKDFSIVDGPGFSGNPHPDRIVQADPRDGTVSAGRRFFRSTVKMFVELARDALEKKGLVERGGSGPIP